MNRLCISQRRRCVGFTLVELMIALVVGLLLLAGVLQVLLGNRESFDAQRARAGLQENARLVTFVLENTLSHAGYRSELANGAPEVLFGANDESGKAAYQKGAIVAGTYEANDSDSVRVRFQAEGGIHDCRGDAVGSPGDPKIADFELYVNDNKSLICHIFPDKNGNGEDREPLVENVERFKVRYGLDTDNSEIGVDTYIADLSGADSTQVLSIRIQLLLKSPDDQKLNTLDVDAEQKYYFSDRSIPYSPDPSQARLARLLVDRTIVLRNAVYELGARRDQG